MTKEVEKDNDFEREVDDMWLEDKLGGGDDGGVGGEDDTGLYVSSWLVGMCVDEVI